MKKLLLASLLISSFSINASNPNRQKTQAEINEEARVQAAKIQAAGHIVAGVLRLGAALATADVLKNLSFQPSDGIRHLPLVGTQKTRNYTGTMYASDMVNTSLKGALSAALYLGVKPICDSAWQETSADSFLTAAVPAILSGVKYTAELATAYYLTNGLACTISAINGGIDRITHPAITEDTKQFKEYTNNHIYNNRNRSWF